MTPDPEFAAEGMGAATIRHALCHRAGVPAIRAPLTDDDLESGGMPPALQPHRRKLYGLTIRPDRLQQIRHERRPDSRYSSPAQVQYEVRTAEQLLQRLHQAPALALGELEMDAKGELDKSRTEIYVPNEFIAKETAKTTNLLFGASINPLRHDALARLDAFLEDPQARVVLRILGLVENLAGDPRAVLPNVELEARLRRSRGLGIARPGLV